MPAELNTDVLDDFSTLLALISLIISIQSTQLYKRNIQSLDPYADKLSLTAIYIATVSNVIELSTAIMEFDKLKESKKPESPRRIKAAGDLLTSRVFSVLASVYLIKASVGTQSTAIEEQAVPNIGGSIL